MQSLPELQWKLGVTSKSVLYYKSNGRNLSHRQIYPLRFTRFFCEEKNQCIVQNILILKRDVLSSWIKLFLFFHVYQLFVFGNENSFSLLNSILAVVSELKLFMQHLFPCPLLSSYNVYNLCPIFKRLWSCFSLYTALLSLHLYRIKEEKFWKCSLRYFRLTAREKSKYLKWSLWFILTTVSYLITIDSMTIDDMLKKNI